MDGTDGRKQTTPEGAEIPVPTREDFLRDLKKVAPRVPRPATDAERDRVAEESYRRADERDRASERDKRARS
jgi:hypothetical protein